MNNNKQFGVWMDTHHATIVGSENPESENFQILANVEADRLTANSERNANNQEQNIMAKFFKDISSHLTNATHVHVTGTGKAQEQFINYLAETAQFKNTKTADSTSNEMSDDKLVEFIAEKF
jgi:stalled ribosome rescue protein Dom34